MNNKNLQTAESVLPGHPDKICDYIADSVLDECLIQDPRARVACEVLAKGRTIHVAGEITSSATFNLDEAVIQAIAHSTTSPKRQDLRIINDLSLQDQQLKENFSHGFAGDQGICVGYACTETNSLIPLPIFLAHRIAAHISANGAAHFLLRDGKTQVTVEYEGYTPKRIHTVICSIQHNPEIRIELIRQAIISLAYQAIIDFGFSTLIDKNTIFLANPEAGLFTVGGFEADCGVTGRKIVVDAYGPSVRVGGGAYSGKSADKVDRSGAYQARYVARQLVLSQIAERVEVEVAYCIGKKEPVALRVNCFGTGNEKHALEYAKRFDYRPEAIIAKFGLLNPIYRKTTNFSHYGRACLPWEK